MGNWSVDFVCLACRKEFTAKYGAWESPDVTCPHCGTSFETDYDINYDEDVSGPWLVGKMAG